jgi:cation transport regulator ChaB
MFLLLVNLYEFGQFLRILLWISVPMFIVAMLVTTWLHYRRRRKTQDEMALSMEGLDLSAAPEILIAAMKRMSVLPMMAAPDAGPTGGESDLPAEERETIAPADAIDNMYKGILWMKSKYEQYRDLADQRIEQLKEQVAKVEKKYEDLLLGRTDQRIETIPAAQDESLLQQQLEAKDRQIEELQTQLQFQYLKTEELVAKLQNSSQLLVNLSHELDKTTLPPQPQA